VVEFSLVSCPRCGEPLDPTDRFCEACGCDLVVRAGTSGVAEIEADRACRSCGRVAVPADGDYCPDCGLRHRERTDRIELDLGDLAGVSDRGLVHARNEDALALGKRLGTSRAAVVSDGVSTSLTPEKASVAAADAALDVLLGPHLDAGSRTREAGTAAARAVGALSDRPNGPSCTMVTAIVEPLEGGGTEITVGWIGDSRAYWLAADGADELLTTDHSWAVEMVAAGLVDAEAAASDRRAHAITRWLGPDSDAGPDVVTLRPDGPGVLLLCTDGLWNYVEDPAELAAVAMPLALTSPLAAAAELTAVALEAGGRDNITIVIIPVTGPATERSRP
jgi:serine/threonine protein phosphatase PrpC